MREIEIERQRESAPRARASETERQSERQSAQSNVRAARALCLGCVDEPVSSFQGIHHRLHHVGIRHFVRASANQVSSVRTYVQGGRAPRVTQQKASNKNEIMT